MGRIHSGYVYIMATHRNGTIYTGVTSNLPRRVWEHKEHLTPGFTSEHGAEKLVYYEEYGTIVEAIAREKVLKKWKRPWKVALIEKDNPNWDDLII